MLAQVRSLIPAPIKRPVRRVLDAVDAMQRRRALRQSTIELRRQVRTRSIAPQLLDELCDAWGNKAYSADRSFVAAVAERAMSSDGPFLDCGSGISTIVAGAIVQERALRLISLEQDAQWYAHICRILSTLELTRVEVWHAPLVTYDDYAWYGLENRTLPETFSHVFCDGPALFPSEWIDPYCSSWRAGLVPTLRSRGVRVGEILLDDAEDVRSAALRERWRALGVATEIVSTPTGAYVLGRAADLPRGGRALA